MGSGGLVRTPPLAHTQLTEAAADCEAPHGQRARDPQQLPSSKPTTELTTELTTVARAGRALDWSGCWWSLRSTAMARCRRC